MTHVAKAASGEGVGPRAANLGSKPEAYADLRLRDQSSGTGESEVAPVDLELTEVLAPVKAELRCAECGYGIVASEVPDTCPMCQSTVWEPVPWRPFSGLADFAGPRRRRRRRSK